MRIALSGINANDNPGPGVGIARSFKEADRNIEVVGLSYDANDSGHHLSHLFDDTVLMPFPGRGWEELKRKLESLQKATPVDLLIPCLDAELPLYIRNQKEIQEQLGIRLFLPSERQFDRRGKDRLHELAGRIGASYPRTLAVSSPEALRRAIDTSFPFPFFIKGKYYKAHLVRSYYEAYAKFDELVAEWGYPVLLQQPVSGSEVNLVGVGDGKGQLLGSVSIKKLTTTSLGKIWTAVTIRNEKLSRLAEEFTRVTKWKGPFELECMATADALALIEINPRFPAWTYFATACGTNLPMSLLQTALGNEPPAPIEATVGMMLVRYTEEIVSHWSHMQSRRPSENSHEIRERANNRRAG